jgi:hypothetical protein
MNTKLAIGLFVLFVLVVAIIIVVCLKFIKPANDNDNGIMTIEPQPAAEVIETVYETVQPDITETTEATLEPTEPSVVIEEEVIFVEDGNIPAEEITEFTI